MTLPILTADDYAMTDGISRSIEALAYDRRLSATSAMTTMPDWPASAPRIREFRDRLSIGLHLNLTVGAPAGAMPRLAPSGVLPALGALTQQALLGRLAPGEVRAEIGRQLDLFERHLGFQPDHVDGHQHVHVLPVVRRALFDECRDRYMTALPLLRVPSRALPPIRLWVSVGAKAAVVRLLASGFGRAADRAGFPTNGRFGGFSAFDTQTSYTAEIAAALADAKLPGGRGTAIVMCHPGYPDAALEAVDAVVERRQQEHDALVQYPSLADQIWHARRPADGAPVNWTAEGMA